MTRIGILIGSTRPNRNGEQQVPISLMTEFENFSIFKPNDYLVTGLNMLLDQVISWSTALAALRTAPTPAA